MDWYSPGIPVRVAITVRPFEFHVIKHSGRIVSVLVENAADFADALRRDTIKHWRCRSFDLPFNIEAPPQMQGIEPPDLGSPPIHAFAHRWW